MARRKDRPLTCVRCRRAVERAYVEDEGAVCESCIKGASDG